MSQDVARCWGATDEQEIVASFKELCLLVGQGREM